MLFINTLVECVILLGQGRRRYDNAFIVKFSMLYANYVVVSLSKFYHGVSSSMMYGKWLKESHFEVKCHDFDRLVLDTRRLSLHTLFDCENDVKRYIMGRRFEATFCRLLMIPWFYSSSVKDLSEACQHLTTEQKS